MRVALTVWENRVSPLFDAACMLLVADVENRVINEKRLEPIRCESPNSRVARLDDLGIDILICGGISNFYANLIESRGIKIVPFAAGPAEEVLMAYINGSIYKKDYRMPGCETLEDTAFE